MNWIIDKGRVPSQRSPLGSGFQVSFASEGGSGTPVPGLSIEVDDVDEVFAAMSSSAFEVIYGPADETWGVRRFYVRDPFGTVVNILSHRP